MKYACDVKEGLLNKLGVLAESKIMVVDIDVIYLSPGSSSKVLSVAAIVSSIQAIQLQWINTIGHGNSI